MPIFCKKIDSFVQTTSLERRKELATKLIRNHPDKFPMFVDLRYKDTIDNNMSLTNHKIMMPIDETFSFLKRLFHNNPYSKSPSHLSGLKAGQAVYLTSVNPESNSESAKFLAYPDSYPLIKLYNDHKCADEFLYIVVTTEDTFG